jgi:hypothetical protein
VRDVCTERAKENLATTNVSNAEQDHVAEARLGGEEFTDDDSDRRKRNGDLEPAEEIRVRAGIRRLWRRSGLCQVAAVEVTPLAAGLSVPARRAAETTAAMGLIKVADSSSLAPAVP